MKPVGSLPSSLYCDLFYSNTGADEYRSDHLLVWIRVHLAGSNQQTQEEILTAFRSAFPGCNVDDEAVGTAASTLIHAGLIRQDGARLSLTPRGMEEVKAASTNYNASRDRFFEFVTNYVDRVGTTSLSDIEREAGRSCIEYSLIRVLAQERDALERLFRQEADFAGLPSQVHARIGELDACLKLKLPGAEALRLLELRRDLLSSLRESTAIGKSYLDTLHRSILGSFFLIQNPNHINNLRAVLRERVYYLDTNVYLAWFYRSQVSHETVRPLIELMRSWGVALRVLPTTVEEIERVETVALRAAQRAESDAAYRRYVLAQRHAIAADYLRLRETDRNLTLAQFQKIHMGVGRILGEAGVGVEDVEFLPNEDFPALQPTFENAIRGAKTDAKKLFTAESVEHDAKVLVALAKLQLRGDRDSMGPRVRFLSLDTGLNRAISEVRNVLKRRIEFADHPSAVARVLIPSTSGLIDAKTYEGYVINAVQSSLGLATELRTFNDLYYIDKLEQAGLPIKALLEVPAHMLEAAVSQLQAKKEFGSRVEMAIASRSDSERDKLASELGRQLMEAIAFQSDVAVENEAIESRLNAESEERERLQLRTLELEEAMSSLKEALHKSEGERLLLRNEVTSAQSRSKSMLWVAALSVVLGLIMVMVLAWMKMH
jgi:hypothetical protein